MNEDPPRTFTYLVCANAEDVSRHDPLYRASTCCACQRSLAIEVAKEKRLTEQSPEKTLLLFCLACFLDQYAYPRKEVPK